MGLWSLFSWCIVMSRDLCLVPNQNIMEENWIRSGCTQGGKLVLERDNLHVHGNVAGERILCVL